MPIEQKWSDTACKYSHSLYRVQIYCIWYSISYTGIPESSIGNINMGAWFDDPDIEMEDIFWFINLASKSLSMVEYLSSRWNDKT